MRLPTLRELGLGIVLILMLCLWFHSCQKQKPVVVSSTALAPSETEKISLDTSKKTVTVTRREKTGQVVQQVLADGSRKATITVNQNGTVTVKAETYEWIFEPGLCAFYSDRPRIGLDADVFYWQRWGVNAGLGYGGRNLDAYAGVSYLLPLQFTGNTSVVLGYSLRKQVVVGLRVRF